MRKILKRAIFAAALSGFVCALILSMSFSFFAKAETAVKTIDMYLIAG